MAKPSEPVPSAAGSDEDDYMNMTFETPGQMQIETSIQRRARKQREAELKARPKTKAEIAADEAAAREAALGTSIDSSNKGFKMMQKLGFKGGALGKARAETEGQVRTEPIVLAMKDDRGGVGMDSEKKRKVREAVEGEVKRVKADEGEYRDRLMREREAKRLEGLFIGAMSVAEKLDDEDENAALDNADNGDRIATEAGEKLNTPARPRLKPLHKVNVLWRANVKHRVERERERRMRYDLYQSLSRRPTYDDADEDKEDRQALGKEEEEIEEEDPELDEFLALEPEARLEKLVAYLRSSWNYCFWCKHRYADERMEGCPGSKEEDHD